MAFSALTTAETDEDSPLDEDLHVKIKDNFDAIHDGTDIVTDLVTQDSIAASAVGRGELKTATETQNTGGPGTQVVTMSSIGQYGFVHQFRVTDAGGSVPVDCDFSWPNLDSGSNGGSTGFVTKVKIVFNDHESSDQADVRSLYVNASPPHYLLGDDPWGQWVYAVVQGSQILRAWSAEDPPAYLRSTGGLVDAYGRPCPRLCGMAKRRPLLHTARPHPFVDDMPEVPDGARVVLLDLRALEQDDPQRWRPDLDELERMEQEAQRHPEGSPLRAMHEEAAAELREVAAERDAEIARADAALASAPQTVDEFAELAADREEVAAKRSREKIRVRIEHLERMVADAGAGDRRRAEADLLLRQHRDALDRYDREKLPAIQAGAAERKARALVQARRNFPVMLRRLRAAAGIVTQRERIQWDLERENGGFLDLLYGVQAERTVKRFDLAAGRVSEFPAGPPRPRHPLLDAAIGGIDAEDAAHPDHKRLPPIPGLFRRGQDGSAPTVTILSPR